MHALKISQRQPHSSNYASESQETNDSPSFWKLASQWQPHPSRKQPTCKCLTPVATPARGQVHRSELSHFCKPRNPNSLISASPPIPESQASKSINSVILCLTCSPSLQTKGKFIFFTSDIEFNLLLVHKFATLSTVQPVLSVTSSDVWVTNTITTVMLSNSIFFVPALVALYFNLCIFKPQNAKT